MRNSFDLLVQKLMTEIDSEAFVVEVTLFENAFKMVVIRLSRTKKREN